MSSVDRLQCPYCRTFLNPGAFVCQGCGAVRGTKPVSFFLIGVVIPVTSFAVMLVVAMMYGTPPPDRGVLLLVLFGPWVGFTVWHIASRKRVQWARGLAAASMVVDEAAAPVVKRESAEDKTCPQCAETVKRAARVCRYCGFEFPANDAEHTSRARS